MEAPENKSLERLTGSYLGKIRTYKADQLNNLVDVLRALSFHVGIREPLGDEQIKGIVSFLRSEFADLTSEDIVKAVQTSASGKLSVDANHYGSFDIIYLGRILNAYRGFKQEASKILPPAPQTEVDEKELFDMLGEHFKEHGEPPSMWGWSGAYNYALSQGYIEPFTDEMLTEIKRKMSAENLQRQYSGKRPIEISNKIINLEAKKNQLTKYYAHRFKKS